MVVSAVSAQEGRFNPDNVKRLRFRRPRPRPKVLGVSDEEGIQGRPVPLRGVPAGKQIRQPTDILFYFQSSTYAFALDCLMANCVATERDLKGWFENGRGFNEL